MNHILSVSFLEILMNLIRIQNEQLLKIIAEEEDIKYETIKHLVPSAYEMKQKILEM